MGPRLHPRGHSGLRLSPGCGTDIRRRAAPGAQQPAAAAGPPGELCGGEAPLAPPRLGRALVRPPSGHRGDRGPWTPSPWPIPAAGSCGGVAILSQGRPSPLAGSCGGAGYGAQEPVPRAPHPRPLSGAAALSGPQARGDPSPHVSSYQRGVETQGRGPSAGP